MKHFVSRELFGYWNRLRGTRMAPERGDIDPAAIRSILADTFVLEVTGCAGARDFPVRLAGTRLNALVTRELKGDSFLSLFAGDERDAIADVLNAVLDDQAAVVAGLKGAPEGGRAPIDLELLLLPLRHHARTHSRVLGALAPQHVPSWLGLLPIRDLALVSFRNVSRPLRGGLAPMHAARTRRTNPCATVDSRSIRAVDDAGCRALSLGALNPPPLPSSRPPERSTSAERPAP